MNNNGQDPSPRQRRKYRQPGTLKDLSKLVWTAILEVVDRLLAPDVDVATTLKCAHAISQLSGSYKRLVATTELEAQVAALYAELEQLKQALG